MSTISPSETKNLIYGLIEKIISYEDQIKSYQNILIDNCEEIYDELRNINITDRKQRNQHNREVKSTKRK